MAELTEREIKIVHLLLTMLNHKFDDVPMDIKQGLLRATLKIRNIPFDEAELVDLVESLRVEQNMIIKNAFGFLAKNQGIMSAFKNLKS